MRHLMFGLVAMAGPVAAEVPRVVTDIAPVHGLVSMVMQGVGSADLILPPGTSPHNYAMRPSEARMLSAADLVVYIGPSLTPWLEGPVETLAASARHMTLMDVEGAHHLELREGAVFEGHDHGHDHGHKEDDADHDDHDDHDNHDDHAAEGALIDPHLWLDPGNAALWLTTIADALSDADPANAGTYKANAAAGQQVIRQTENEVNAMLAPVRGTPFVVLHDGFHYFEAHFDIEATAAVSDSEAAKPGAARVSEVKAHFQEAGVKCAFSEPQVDPSLLQTVSEGTEIKTGILDPIGAEIPLGSAHYPALLKSLAQEISTCLTP